MHINTLLKMALDRGASDVHLKTGSHPWIRVDGTLIPITEVKRLTGEDTAKIAFSIMTEPQKEYFQANRDIDFSYSVSGLGRFRVNSFYQRGTVGIVLRIISFDIRTVRELNLPSILENIAMAQRGLVLVTGTTGSGKSTTLASMIDYINTHRIDHIITIEDPIEYVHRDKRSIINQRELETDTSSFSIALRAALRADPDVVLVGEMRDLDTIETALIAAETGHLVLSTLHTVDATETINRIISIFPPFQQKQIRIQLATVLKSVISQRLMKTADGKGRVPAVEILIATKYIQECIENKDKTGMIRDAIAAGTSQYGMQTFDQSLFYLFRQGMITEEEAMRGATNPADLKLKLQGIESASDVARKQMESEIFGDE
ncbi:MAG TPA: type IV pilus twitching motility protein PilT [Acidobacteriota bacterium]|nr:type IV pilus twitching motility protein PilT [Acidobacteriota bacterium]